jgi:glycosyltransferase involved in cell wall biosynthesis
VKLLAVLSSLMGGGAERQMTLMLRHLDRDRFDPTLCLLSGAEDDYRCEVPPHVRVVDLGKRSASDIAKVTWRLSRLLASDEYGLTVSRVDYTNALSVAAARLSGTHVPVVVVEDSVQSRELAGRPDRRLRAAIVRSTYRHATAIVAPTAGVKSEVLRSVPGLPIPVVVIPNMVDLEAVRSAAIDDVRHPFASEPVPLAVAVGRLDRSKGFDVLLRALARLNERTTCNLALLGRGGELDALQSQAASLGLTDRVHFAGFVDNPFAWMRRADVVICSSRWESFGNVLIEAMALGKPVVSTDAPYGPRYLVENGVSGLVGRVDDPTDLARMIQIVLSDRTLSSRLGEGARQRAEAFDAATVTARFEELFRVTVGERPN